MGRADPRPDPADRWWIYSPTQQLVGGSQLCGRWSLPAAGVDLWAGPPVALAVWWAGPMIAHPRQLESIRSPGELVQRGCSREFLLDPTLPARTLGPLA